MDPQPRGPDWMQITPKAGSLFHAYSQTGVYFDEGGHPMLGSALVRDPKFQDRVFAETRALLATVPGTTE